MSLKVLNSLEAIADGRLVVIFHKGTGDNLSHWNTIIIVDEFFIRVIMLLASGINCVWI